MADTQNLGELADQIESLVRAYSAKAHASNSPADIAAGPFVPGQTPVPYAGRVFGGDEVAAAVRSALEFWLTLGPQGDAFEESLPPIWA